MDRIACVAVSLLIVACASGETDGSTAGPGAGNVAGSGGTGGGFMGTGGAGNSLPVVKEVFGQSSRDLYRLDPTSNEVTVVGSFSGCNYVVDIAIDEDNRMIASTLSSLWEIDPLTATCTLIAEGNFPNALSFLPVGALLPESEALVGYINTMFVRIDTQTGAITTVGEITGGYFSSGDIVSVAGGGTYLTVKGNNCDDCIVQIEPTTGDIIRNFGDLGFADVFGLAYWGGSAYGFSSFGDLFQIAFAGDTIATTVIDIPSAPDDLSFAGAGSSTLAPVGPP